MIAPRVLTEDEVFSALRDRGFIDTSVETDTGSFWRHAGSGEHLQVPKSLDGFYPDWMLYDLMSRIGEIVPSQTSNYETPDRSIGNVTKH